MNRLKRFCIINALFVLTAGTLLHFVYEWSGSNPIAGLFSPVNESTWEHMKLIFFPMLLCLPFMVLRLRGSYPCILSAMSAGILLGTFFIPVFFYTYTGILGRNYFIMDLLTFALAVIAAFYTVYRLAVSCRLQRYTIPAAAAVVLLLICFLAFTYYPPQLGLFAEPVQSASLTVIRLSI